MSTQARLTFIRDGVPTTQLFPAATGTDREFLLRYLTEVSRLEAVSKRLSSSKISLNLKFGSEEGVSSASWDGIPEDTYAALLLRIRPFILQEEDLFYFKIKNVISRSLTSADSKVMLNQIGGLFKGDKLLEGIDARNALPELYSDGLLYDYLNAEEYHRDTKKIEKISDGGTFMYAFRKYAAFEALHHKLRAVMLQAGVANSLVHDLPFSFNLTPKSD